MREFFTGQMDYILFVYGFSFICLAATAFLIYLRDKRIVLWQWVGMFGLMHGAAEWMDLVEMTTGAYPFWLKIGRIFLNSASFLCLIEGARVSMAGRRETFSGRWLYVLLIGSLVPAWLAGGPGGVNVLSRVLFGFGGSLLVAREFRRMVGDGNDRRWLDGLALVMAAYGSTQLLCPRTPFLWTSVINQETFLSLTGVPVPLIRSLLVFSAAVLVWKCFIAAEHEKIGPGDLWIARALPLILGVVIVTGGCVTSFIAAVAVDEDKNAILHIAEGVAAGIDLEPFKKLSGTPQDRDVAAYQAIRAGFLRADEAVPGVRYIYLMGTRGRQIFFFMDSEPKKFASSGAKPTATPGDIYVDAPSGLTGSFQGKPPYIEGPYTDAWGTFISAFVPVVDPASGGVIAVLGMDVEAGAWAANIAGHRLLVIFVFLLIAMILLIFLLVQQREEHIRIILARKRLQLEEERHQLETSMAERNMIAVDLRESEERFLRVMYTSPEAILIIDGDVFVDCNEATARMLGCATRGEFLKTHPSRLSPPVQPDGQSSFAKANEMMRLAKEQGRHTFEWVHRRANGGDFPVQVSLTAITLHGRGVLHCVWVDLTRQKEDEKQALEYQRTLAARTGELNEALEAARHSEDILVSMLDDNTLMRSRFEQTARQMRLILESSGDGVFGLDLEGRHTFVNPQALLMLGYNEEELLGRESHAIWHHSRPGGSPYPVNECPNYRCINKTVPVSGEEFYWRKDGSGFPVEYNARPLVEDGRTVGAVVSFRDITQRKKNEELLKNSEERIRSVTDSAIDAIVMMDPRGVVSFWNPAAERIFGYSAREAIGQNLHRFFVPERFLGAHDAAFPNFLKTGKGVAVGKTLELAAIRKDGVEIPVDLSLSAIRRSDGWHSVGILRDITERKVSQEKLRTLTLAIEQSPNSIVITDTVGTIEYVNPKFEEVTGYAAAEAIGLNPRILKSGDMSAEGYKQLWETLISGHEWRGEFHNRKKNGDLYWENASITPVRDKDGKTTQYVAVKEDITERKVAEEAMRSMQKSLADSQAQLFQTSKLATLGEMSTGLAHEINQPLGGIALVATTFRKLQEKKLMTDEKLANGVKDIELCVKRMTNIINHIRAFARQEAMQFQSLDVTGTIESAIGLLSAQLREHEIEVETSIEPGLPQIQGEPFQLEQVWINAFSNARDAMDLKQRMIAEGQIALEGYRKKVVVAVSHDKAQDMILVAITDNGNGISDEHKEKAFDPFFTTKEVGKGTGLGLSISYGIIESHKGKISLEGKPGEGATLRAYLPVTR